MSYRAARTIAALVTIDRRSGTPVYYSIYCAIRRAVLEKQLTAGVRLPSSRGLASALNVSRSTVLNAYELLAAEGIINGRRGGGTRIANGVFDRQPASGSSDARGSRSANAPFNAISGTKVGSAGLDRPLPFALGSPALDGFPVASWARLSARRWRESPQLMLAPADGPGFAPLREAIANYVVSLRGITTTAENILITAGAQQAFCLIAKLLLNPGDAVWVEDCGYVPARAALTDVGARPIGIPVDDEGLDVALARREAYAARMALVTPACEPPFGCQMSVRRRMQLLDWAEQADAWIVEDDYNGELRYEGHSQPALAATDHPGARRVIYVRTFSKTLFPALRLGFAVLPPALVSRFARGRLLADRHSPTAEQAVLTDFILSGRFARHVRRMSRLCAERQRTFLSLASTELGSLLDCRSASAGLRVVGLLPPGVSDRLVAEEARRRGIAVEALSEQSMGSSKDRGLVFGYAPFLARETCDGLRQLATAIRAVRGAR